MEGLGQEALNAAGPVHRGAILRAQLVHAQDRDDILQLLVFLQHHLHRPGGLIVFLAQGARLQDAGAGLQRIHRRVDAQLRDGAGQHRRGVQMGEGGGRGGVGQVVRGHIDGLDGGDGAVLGGGDALLQVAHLGGQGRLIADGGGHAAQQRRDLGTGLGETEDVVDEEQHVLAALVAEVLRDGQARQGHAQTGSGRLVHLAEDQGGLVDDAALGHLVPEVVALAAALADAGEDRIAAVLIGHVADQLLDQHRLAHTGAAEEADLAALGIGRQQVDDLDAGLQQLGGREDIGKDRRLAVDGQALLRLHGALAVDGLAHHVEHAAEGRLTHRHGDGTAGVVGLAAAGDAVGRGQGDAAHVAAADLLYDLKHDLAVLQRNLHRVVDLRQRARREMHIDHGADDSFYDSFFHGRLHDFL